MMFVMLVRRWAVWLKSDAFDDGAAIPRQFTGEGEDVSPPLGWSDAPSGTRSFAVLCEDPDAPSGTWHHWAAYDIAAGCKGLPAGVQAGRQGFLQALNDFGKPGYGGPFPPRNDGPHRYCFHLLALSAGQLEVRRDPSCMQVEREARRHVLAEAVLTGIYER
jgi:Raf kinase inhibitor-like YbhB/YbcL family protein